MTLETTKQQYVILKACQDNAENWDDLFKKMEEISMEVFGTTTYAKAPIPFNSIIRHFVDEKVIDCKKLIKLTDLGEKALLLTEWNAQEAIDEHAYTLSCT